MARPGTRLGILSLVAATALWSLTSLFVKHFYRLNVAGDVQNLFRYLAAAVGLWLFAGLFFRREAIRAVGQWRLFLLPAALNCAFQVTMVSALYHRSILPGFSSLLSKVSVVFAAVLAFILFRDERPTIRSGRYLVGAVLSLAGVAGVILLAEGAEADFGEGATLVVLAAFLWACYTLAMKHTVRGVRPLIAFTAVATYTTGFFVVRASLTSAPTQFGTLLGPRDQFLMLLSGVLCIAMAHSFYFRAVERLGVAVCASFLLVQPLLTGAGSAVLYGERLTPGQMLMGGVLLAGTWLVIRARRSAPPGPP